MTRKEEIRGMAIQLQSAVKDKRRRWLPIKDFKTLLSFILELTAHESSPAPLESQEEAAFIEGYKVRALASNMPFDWMSKARAVELFKEWKGRKEGDLQE